MALAVEVAGKTDIGCVRANNEDNFGFDVRYGIFVVCDGMGGQAAGEVASKLGVDVLLEYFRNAPEDSNNTGKLDTLGPEPPGADPKDGTTPVVSPGASALAKAIHLANRKIHEAGQNQNERSGMGSTIVAAVVRGNSLAIGHVGDSRIYLLRNGVIQQLTQDHSLVMEQVRMGLITLEQAEHSEMQHVILRALGSEETVVADIDDLLTVPGDLILMTSDGLTRHVHDDDILAIITQSASLEQACAALIQAAKDRGGDDNITCLLLKVIERPWYKKLFSKLFSGGPQWQNSI